MSEAATAPGKAPSMGTFERYLTLWVALCIIVGIALGQAVPTLFHALGEATVAQVNLPGRRAGLADDRSHAAEDRSCRARSGAQPLAGDRRDRGCQLAGQTLLHGLARLAVHRPSVPAFSARRPDQRLHCRTNPAGGGSLHRHGVRLVEPRGWRATLHAVASCAQRHDHGLRLRPACCTAARPVLDHRALGHAHTVRRALHHRAGDRRRSFGAGNF